MYIREIEIDNFKSFANQVNIHFWKDYNNLGRMDRGKVTLLIVFYLLWDYLLQERSEQRVK
jgi:hypothetical protein